MKPGVRHQAGQGFGGAQLLAVGSIPDISANWSAKVAVPPNDQAS